MWCVNGRSYYNVGGLSDLPHHGPNVNGCQSVDQALRGLAEQFEGEELPDGTTGLEFKLEIEQLGDEWTLTIGGERESVSNRYEVIVKIIGFTHSEEYEGTTEEAQKIAEMLLLWDGSFLEYRDGMTFMIEPIGNL